MLGRRRANGQRKQKRDSANAEKQLKNGNGAKVIAVSLRATPCTAAVLLFGSSARFSIMGRVLGSAAKPPLVSRQAHAP